MDSDEEEEAQPTRESDRVRNEVKLWENLAAERIEHFKDAHGLLDEFALHYAMRDETPLHTKLF